MNLGALNWLLATRRGKVGLLAGSIGFYLLLYAVLERPTGGSVTAFALLPVMVAGSLYGLRGGLLAGLLAFLLNLLLANWTGLMTIEQALAQGAVFGGGALLLLGGWVGWIFDQRRAMERELRARRNAERLLRLEQQRQRTITDHLHDLVGYTDAQGRYLYVSPAVQATLGYAPEAVLGKTPFDFAHPDDRQRMEQSFARLMTSGVLGREEFRFQCANGQALWMEVVGAVIPDERGQPVELIFMARDVHHRHVENQVLRQNAAMARALLDSPNDAALLIDRQGKILDANEDAQRRLKMPIEQLLGRSIYDFSLPHLSEARRKRAEEVIRSRKAQHIEETYGSATFETSVYPVLDDVGDVANLAVFIRDVTRYRKAEQAERERSQQLRRANALLAALTQVATRCDSVIDVDEILRALGRELQVLGLHCLVALIDAEEERFISRYLSLDDPTLSALHRLTGFSMADFSFRTDNFEPYEQLAQQHLGWFAADLKALLTHALPGPSSEQMERILGLAQISEQTQGVFAPLLVQDRLLGLLGLWGETLQADDVPAAMLFASQIANVLEKARLYAEVQRLSMTDELTGLYNRRGLFGLGRRELERAQRFRRPLGVLMLDVDHFKEINDTKGHIAGDLVLVEVAACLRRVARELDVAARYGGDEFVLLLIETDAEEGEQARQRLLNAIQELEVVYAGGVMPVSISCGLAVLDETIPDLEMLIDRADQALYQHKRRWKVDSFEPPVIH